MGDSITWLSVITGGSVSVGKPMSSKESTKKGLLTTIFQIITDTLKTWIYSSKKVSRNYQLRDLHTFSQSSYVGSGAIMKLAEAINKENNMVVDINGTHHFCSINYPEINGPKLIGVPVVLEGGWYGIAPNHIVTFVYDPGKQTLEYYDAKGIAIEERGDAKTIQGKSLVEIQNEMMQKYGAETLIQNHERHQQDIHNCGVYVSDYLLRRSKGESFSAIQKEPLTFAAANNSRRQELINYVESILSSEQIETKFEVVEWE